MRIGVSNIAWHASEDAAVLALLADEGIDALEIAPTRVFADPLSVTPQHAHRASATFAGQGLQVVAFQSLLFGHNELTIFESSDVRAATKEHIAGFIDLAGAMGVSTLVFGSPRNRRVPAAMTDDQAFDIATEFFRSLGARADDVGTVLCVEPNPEVYECNFVTTAEQGVRLVDAVNSPGFGLHLDAAGLTLSGEDLAASIAMAGLRVRHFHASAPFLGDLEEEAVDHTAAARALDQVGYSGVVSVEMRAHEAGSNAERVSAAIRLSRSRYGSGSTPTE